MLGQNMADLIPITKEKALQEDTMLHNSTIFQKSPSVSRLNKDLEVALLEKETAEGLDNNDDDESDSNASSIQNPGDADDDVDGQGDQQEKSAPEFVLEPNPDSIILNIPLNDPSLQKTLVINYPSLLSLHIDKAKKSAKAPGIIESSMCSSNQYAINNEDSNRKSEPSEVPKKKGRKKKWDIEDEYNVNDGWIDDSEAPEHGMAPGEAPLWEYGWFAWKGDVNALFKQSGKGKVSDETPIISSAKANVEKVKVNPSPTKKKKKDELVIIEIFDNNDQKQSENFDGSKKLKKNKDVKGSAILSKPLKKITKGSTSEVISTPKKKNPARGEPIIEYNPIGLHPMPLPVFKELDVLYKEAKKCDFTVKKNFPHTLKPIFSDCVSSAMDYQVLNPNFWSHITSILPYNSFTMKKLTSRQVYPDRMASLNKEIPVAYSEFEAELSRALEEQANEMQDGKKFRFDEKLRIIFWNILCLEWEIAEMDNDIKRLDKQPPVFAEAAVRKAVYSKMVGYWPAGAMETGVLSNQYSQFKKKREKTEDENGFQYPEETPYGIIKVDPYARIVPKPRIKKEDSVIVLDSPEKIGEKRKLMEVEVPVSGKKSKVD